ncbi:hypothetical protein KW849_09595 [Pseudomonas sp. PDM26]|uniref:hypothetical protein n=1 Tax=Pseudomonas sp. PDM26 TaxID=2854766 RepID=UPI001C43E707|nr:hypothetical protein [Pseudomonas sp. PDM26]MBV7546544.1 hypothetical protein [Pseudomonas sp. PDM26]
MKRALPAGERHVKKSLKRRKNLVTESAAQKPFSSRDCCRYILLTQLGGLQKKQSSSRPTKKKHHVPGGI